MFYTVSVEARCAQVSANGDLGIRVLSGLWDMAHVGRIAGPAVSEDLAAMTIGATVTVEHEPDPVRAAEIGRTAFCEALAQATGDPLGAVDVMQIVVTAEEATEEAATVAG
ncbi:MAG: hypothetical protein ACYCT1_08120 [Steroidobacteraceae bacterium]